VTGLSGVSRIWAADFHSIALKTDGLAAGSLWGWGANIYGQLGTGDDDHRTIPVKILDGVTGAAVGSLHTLAIKDDGSLWAWGAGGGQRGRLGDGSRVNRFSPVQAWGLRDVVDVAAGGVYSAALRADGSVFAWGYNLLGTSSDVPVPIDGLSLVENAWLGEDDDGDGLSAYGEWRSGCDPLVADTNGDGIRDGTSVELGVSCSNPDQDADGVLNADELAGGTSPWSADTDGDGVADGADCAPLDPGRATCPADPEDHTPPAVTILEPPNATPLP
jgi:Regulator of chromosome condensation (RCC1) repeat